MDILTYVLAKNYTDKALLGVGTIKGAPCTVKSQTEDDEYVYVTLGWENSLGTPEETIVKIKKGADGAPGEPGPAGDPGPQGVSITKIEKIKTEDLIDTYQISFSDNTIFEYTISNGSTNYLNITNKPSIEGVELIGNKTFEDLNIASADALNATDENLQNLSNLIGDKTSLPAPTDTIVNNITSVDAKVDAIIDDNEAGLAKTFSSDKITKTFATKEEIPTVPNKVSELTNDSNYQTADQVNSTVTTEIAKIVADAPEDLNTLKEMSDWIAGHENDASAMNSAISDNKTAITALQTGKADKSEIPTTLPADGGNSDTVNNHTVETDVPVDAVFTDTIYDDKEVKESIEQLNSNLDSLGYGDESGNSNLLNLNKCSFNKNNISISLEDNEITVNGSYYSNLLFDKLLDAGSYSISFEVKSSTSSYKVIRVLYEDNTFSDEIYHAKNIVAEKKLKGLMLYSSGNADVGTAVFKNIQIEKGTTATPYKPYIPSVKMLAEENAQQNTKTMDIKMLGWSVPKECPIQNSVNGNQFVQSVVRIDLGTLNWNYHENGGSFYTVLDDGKKTGVDIGVDCYLYGYECYKENAHNIGNNQVSVGSSFVSSYVCSLVIKDTRYPDTTAFKNAMKGKYLYYELETPITMTIDGNEVTERINESLEDYGLDNKCPELGQGYCNFMTTGNEFQWISQPSTFIGTKNPIDCMSGDIIRVLFNFVPNNIVVQWNDGTHTRVDNANELSAVVPSGVTKCCAYCATQDLTPTTIGNVRIYVNNAIDELKNDLDTLELSEVAGGKNLFDGKIIVGEGIYAYAKLPKSNVHISISDRDINVDISNISFGLSNTVVPNTDTMNWAFVNNGTIVGRDSNDFVNSSFTAKSLSIFPNDANTVTKILQRFNIQIEEGDTATPYEPYIPSVKMIAEEVDNVNDSLDEQGLLNKFDNQYNDGFYETDGKFYANPQWKSTKNAMGVSSGDILSVNFIGTPTYARVVFFDDDNTFVSYTSFDKNIKAKVATPSGATKYFISFFPNTVTVDSIYINNAIDELKNDLDKLNSLPKGSIIQIDADKDDIETTKQKYGWQYLGTSNISYESGSANILVTNVYRKNN